MRCSAAKTEIRWSRNRTSGLLKVGRWRLLAGNEFRYGLRRLARVLRDTGRNRMTRAGDEKRSCPHCAKGQTWIVGISRARVVRLQCDTCGYKAMAEHPCDEAVSDLANALQVVLGISTDLQDKDSERGTDLAQLQDAVTRAVAALNELRSG